jgi:hypothetical protein
MKKWKDLLQKFLFRLYSGLCHTTEEVCRLGYLIDWKLSELLLQKEEHS